MKLFIVTTLTLCNLLHVRGILHNPTWIESDAIDKGCSGNTRTWLVLCEYANGWTTSDCDYPSFSTFKGEPVAAQHRLSEDEGLAEIETEDPTCRDHVLHNDLGVRFNKVIFPDDEEPSDTDDILPLGKLDFPITSNTAEFLRQSKCPSVIREEDCWECEFSFEELIEDIGGLPSHPMKYDLYGEYWDELREVIHARHERLRGTDPLKLDSFIQLPKIWKDFTLKNIADAVHNEYPGENQANLISDFTSNGVPMDNDIIPSVNVVDFLRYQVLLAEINTWSIGVVGPSNFGLKFYAGRARPEEIVWFLKEAMDDDIDEVLAWDIPQDILVDIEDMNLQHPYDFTAYWEGSPTHPSWPAMHSAGSVASFWLAIVMDLNEEQLCEAQALDWGVSYGRTIAGVHFPADNIAGLNLGQEILARKLPGYLADRFGSDEDAVREKIDRYRFNWNTYLHGPCH